MTPPPFFFFNLPGPIREADRVTHTTLDDADLIGRNHHLAKLCANIQAALLRNDQKVAVRVVKCSVIHGLVGCEDMYGQAGACTRLTRDSHCLETLHKIDLVAFGREIKWAPAQLGWRHLCIRCTRHDKLVKVVVQGLKWSVDHGRSDAIKPADI